MAARGGEGQRRGGGRPMPPSARGPPGPPIHSKPGPRFEPVDREKTCPLLLRVFTKVGGHHNQADFAVRGKEPKDEVQIYTWMDATLRELTDLVKEVAPEARRRDALLSFAFVYPTKTGHFTVKEVGKTFSYPNARRPDDGSKALGTLSFETQGRESIATKLVANLITEAGADRVLACDLHSGQLMGYFDIPVDHVHGQVIESEQDMKICNFH